MRLVRKDKAEQRDCPTVDRKCQGATCMAWIEMEGFEVRHKNHPESVRFVLKQQISSVVGGNPKDWTMQPAIMGRCGMVPR